MKAAVVLLVAVLGLPSPAAADVVVPIGSVKQFVNIRAEPNGDSDVIARLYKGDSMPLVQSVDGWYEVEIEEDLNGYISSDWTEVLTEAELQAVGAGEGVSEASRKAVDRPAPQAMEDATAPPEAAGKAAEAEQAGETMPIEPPAAEMQPEATEPSGEPLATEPRSIDEADSGERSTEVAEFSAEPDIADVYGIPGPPGLAGPVGPQGPVGPAGPAGAASLEGSVDFLTKFTTPTTGGSSQVFDDGRNVGIGTTEPQQRLDVNGSVRIHDRNSNVAGLIITQASGETGYIMHNRGSILTIGAGSVDRITIDNDGNVGFGNPKPSHPIDMASGAHVTVGGVWTNSSSKKDKENIAGLTSEDALMVLSKLEPVRFNYKADADDEYVGFIAEDVPELVASKDRTGLSAMDIVAVLTKVVQVQQQRIERLEARLED